MWDGFGYEMNKSLHDFDYSEADEIIGSLTIKVETPQDKNVKLDGKIFVITGKLIYHNNRQQLINEIEAEGGKVASAVSSKTNYLVNNDVQSTSAKNKKALELKVPIITEEELMEMMEDE
jgi:DNA ligase (NAD+)